MNQRLPTHEDLMLYADGELDGEQAARVEAYLEQDAEARDIVASLRELGNQVRWVAEARAKAGGADDIADWVMSRIEQDGAGKVVRLPAKRLGASGGGVGSTGSVWPIAVGALAAAAAVALVVWRFAGLDVVAPVQPPQATPAPSMETEMVVASANAPAPDFDPEPGVSVDAIDFGARTGTIFYVPSDTGTTTVVWVTDDEAN